MGFLKKFIYDKPWKKDSMFAVRMLSWVSLSFSKKKGACSCTPFVHSVDLL